MPSKKTIDELKDHFLHGKILTEEALHDLLHSVHPDITEGEHVSIPIKLNVDWMAMPAPSGNWPSSVNGTYEVITIKLSNSVTLFSGWINAKYSFQPSVIGNVNINFVSATPLIADLPAYIPEWERWIGLVPKQWGIRSNDTNATEVNTMGSNPKTIDVDFTESGIKALNYGSGKIGVAVTLKNNVMMSNSSISFTGSEMFVLVDVDES